MNALVISGGGSKGAYAGGLTEYLMDDCGREYDLFIGTSTGSLLAPLLAANKLDVAKQVFTTVTQKSIFKTCPFRIKKIGPQEFVTSVNHLGILKLFLMGKRTVGDSSNLRKMIRSCFFEDDFKRIKDSGKKAIVTVSNLTNESVEYKSSDDYTYEEFCDWMWASANALPFMSLFVKDGKEYGDGAFGSAIPIQKAINEGACWIDVVALRPAKKIKENPSSKNVLHVLMNTFDFILNQISLDDLVIGQLEANKNNVDIHFYYTPRILSKHTFIFDPEQMSNWWEEGFLKGKAIIPRSHCIKCIENTEDIV